MHHMRRVHIQGNSVFIFFGFLVVIFSVFGSFVALGGHLGALYQPFEFVLIAGAAAGAYIASSSGKSIVLLLRALPGALRRTPYDKSLYMELMALMYVLLGKARREGMMSIEQDIENPHESAVFSAYGRIRRDRNLMDFITDYLRLMVSGNMSSIEIESLMDEDIETQLHEKHTPVVALRAAADALPAFGIVAAVLGVIKALAAVDAPPVVLGVLLAYGFVAPLASCIERRCNCAMKVLECVKTTLLASMNGYPPQLAVEFGRKVLYSNVRPSFLELENHMRQVRGAGKSE
jgi:chemotaxis protein MotA